MCICRGRTCVCEHRVLRIPGAGVPGGCEAREVGAGNWVSPEERYVCTLNWRAISPAHVCLLFNMVLLAPNSWSSSWVLGLQAWATRPRSDSYFKVSGVAFQVSLVIWYNIITDPKDLECGYLWGGITITTSNDNLHCPRGTVTLQTVFKY